MTNFTKIFNTASKFWHFWSNYTAKFILGLDFEFFSFSCLRLWGFHLPWASIFLLLHFDFDSTHLVVAWPLRFFVISLRRYWIYIQFNIRTLSPTPREAHCYHCGRHYWRGLMGGSCDRCPAGRREREKEEEEEESESWWFWSCVSVNNEHL